MQLHFVELATFLVRNNEQLVPYFIVCAMSKSVLNNEFCELWLKVT